MGWFDGNPAYLWEHPPAQAAQRYVSCLGGVDRTISKAEEFVKDGDLRFAATLLNQAVYTEPESFKARIALASVYERLGYGAENAPWRNFYLTGAHELQEGAKPVPLNLAGVESVEHLTVDQLLDSLTIRLDGPKSFGISSTIGLYLTDLLRQWRLTLSNGALTYNSLPLTSRRTEGSNLVCIITRMQLLGIVTRQQLSDDIEVQGDPSLLKQLLALLTKPDTAFPIVTPRICS